MLAPVCAMVNIEEVDPTIRTARGYGCSTTEDLVGAYRLLGCKQVVVKPDFGAAGEGILFLDSEEQLRMYDFPMGNVSLEEFLDLDKSADGLILSPAMVSRIALTVSDPVIETALNAVYWE